MGRIIGQGRCMATASHCFAEGSVSISYTYFSPHKITLGSASLLQPDGLLASLQQVARQAGKQGQVKVRTNIL